MSTTGSFNSLTGIEATSSFGSSKAFGFGISTCGANCFNHHASILRITFGAPTFVSSIQFDEIALCDNWGSDGRIPVDGSSVTGRSTDFGRLPYDDRRPDGFLRTQRFAAIDR